MNISETQICIPEQFGEVERHWCPYSEPFTGCDALFSALQEGWRISGGVFCREVCYSGNRKSLIFYFRLNKGNELCRMAVIGNPQVTNFLDRTKLQVLTLKSMPVETVQITTAAAKTDATDIDQFHQALA
jgi:hypothetical protein